MKINVSSESVILQNWVFPSWSRVQQSCKVHKRFTNEFFQLPGFFCTFSLPLSSGKSVWKSMASRVVEDIECCTLHLNSATFSTGSEGVWESKKKKEARLGCYEVVRWRTSLACRSRLSWQESFYRMHENIWFVRFVYSIYPHGVSWMGSLPFIHFFLLDCSAAGRNSLLTPNAFLARMELRPSTVGDFTGISPDLFIFYYIFAWIWIYFTWLLWKQAACEQAARGLIAFSPLWGTRQQG